jgi:glycosyltransferase involved in cell wall biosynthesis
MAGSPRLRIALLHYTTPPIVGGVETVLARHAHHLVREGFEVHVLTGRGGGMGAGVRLRRNALLDSRHPRILAVTRALEGGRVPPEFAALTTQIASGLEHALAGVDVCIVHNALTMHKNLPLTAALHRIAARRGLPRFVAWCHDLAWANPQYQAHLYPGVPWHLLQTQLPGATYVTVSGDRQRALSAGLGLPRSAVEVIPNGIDPGTFLRLTSVGQWLADTFRLWEQEVWLTPSCSPAGMRDSASPSWRPDSPAFPRSRPISQRSGPSVATPSTRLPWTSPPRRSPRRSSVS